MVYVQGIVLHRHRTKQFFVRTLQFFFYFANTYAKKNQVQRLDWVGARNVVVNI